VDACLTWCNNFFFKKNTKKTSRSVKSCPLSFGFTIQFGFLAIGLSFELVLMAFGLDNAIECKWYCEKL
jgi:hypothetical protein